MASAHRHQDLYRLLGVSSSASTEEIKKAYRERAKQLHPDRNPRVTAAEEFKCIAEAYSVLVDSQRRALYDCYGTVPRSTGAATDAMRLYCELFGELGSGMSSGMTSNSDHTSARNASFSGAGELLTVSMDEDDESSDVQQIGCFEALARSCGHASTSGRELMDGMLEHSLLGTVMDAMDATMQSHSLLLQKRIHSMTNVPATSSNQLTLVPVRSFPLNVTLEELYTGCIKRLHYTRNMINPVTAQVACSSQQFLDVAVQPGWRHGTRLTYRGIGDQLGDGHTSRQATSASGDLVVVIQEQPHQHYARCGNDLITIQRVPLLTALTGGCVQVNKLDDQSVDVPLTTIIAPGSEVVLGGQGMPDPENPAGTHGNLIVRFEVDFPRTLDAAAQTKLREIPELQRQAQLVPVQRPPSGGQRDCETSPSS